MNRVQRREVLSPARQSSRSWTGPPPPLSRYSDSRSCLCISLDNISLCFTSACAPSDRLPSIPTLKLVSCDDLPPSSPRRESHGSNRPPLSLPPSLRNRRSFKASNQSPVPPVCPLPWSRFTLFKRREAPREYVDIRVGRDGHWLWTEHNLKFEHFRQ